MVLFDAENVGNEQDKERPIWTVASSRLLLDRAPWLRVWQQEVHLPNGIVIPDYLLTKGRSFAMIFPLTPEGQVVMVEQYKHGPGHWMLDLPAGYLEEDDPSPLETARRELLEETGYTSEEWHPLGEFVNNPNRSADKACFFLALGARRIQGQHLDEAEDILVRLVPLEEMTGLVLEGRIESLSTACALLLGLEALRQRGRTGTS